MNPVANYHCSSQKYMIEETFQPPFIKFSLHSVAIFPCCTMLLPSCESAAEFLSLLCSHVKKVIKAKDTSTEKKLSLDVGSAISVSFDMSFVGFCFLVVFQLY